MNRTDTLIGVTLLGCMAWMPALLAADQGQTVPPSEEERRASELESAFESKAFDGWYAGVDFGEHNVFGGAFLDGVDVLTQEDRSVLDLSLGWRREFESRLVVGLEFRYGLLDGDLERQTVLEELTIRYRNDSQYGFRLAVGGVVGPRRETLVYGFYGETGRDFDITIEIADVSFEQRDHQGFKNFGAAVERRFREGWSAQLSATMLAVDFGPLVTNIDIDEDLALSAGLRYRF